MKDSQRASNRQWIDLGISSTVSVKSTSSPAHHKTEPIPLQSDSFALYSPPPKGRYNKAASTRKEDFGGVAAAFDFKAAGFEFFPDR